MHYVISDIHGYWSWFVRMFSLDGQLGKVRLGPDDRVHVIGDCCDRGPHGVKIWSYIRQDPRFVLLMGNHELMAAGSFGGSDLSDEYLGMWLRNGGQPTRDAMLAMPAHDRDDLLAWLASLPEWADVDAGGRRFRLVHAGWSDTDQAVRLWERPSPYKPMPCQGRELVVGHTPVCFLHPAGPSSYLSKCGRHMRIHKGTYFTCIDCGCGDAHLSRQALACLRLDDMAEFYVTSSDLACGGPLS